MQDSKKTEVEIFQNVYTIGRRVFVKILRTFTIEVEINSNHVVQHLALHTVGRHCPALNDSFDFFPISDNEYNTVGKSKL